MRKILVIAIVLGCTSILVAGPPAGAGDRRCFGRRATIFTWEWSDVRGTEGPDVIVAPNAGAIYARGGDDRICGGGGNEAIYGGEGDDKMDGEDGVTAHLSGGPGGDFFRRGIARFDGAPGRVRVDLDEKRASGYGHDHLTPSIHIVVGSAFDDVLKGGPGGDILYGAGGRDFIHGRRNFDQLFGDHTRGGGRHNESEGSAGGDEIRGGSDGDRIHAGPGADTLFGQGGRDELVGDRGRDTGNGGGGNDDCHVEVESNCP